MKYIQGNNFQKQVGALEGPSLLCNLEPAKQYFSQTMKRVIFQSNTQEHKLPSCEYEIKFESNVQSICLWSYQLYQNF